MERLQRNHYSLSTRVIAGILAFTFLSLSLDLPAWALAPQRFYAPERRSAGTDRVLARCALAALFSSQTTARQLSSDFFLSTGSITLGLPDGGTGKFSATGNPGVIRCALTPPGEGVSAARGYEFTCTDFSSFLGTDDPVLGVLGAFDEGRIDITVLGADATVTYGASQEAVIREIFSAYGQGVPEEVVPLRQSFLASQPHRIRSSNGRDYVLMAKALPVHEGDRQARLEEIISWEQEFMARLREAGFTQVPLIIPSATGPSVPHEGETFVLYEHKEGAQLPWGSIQQDLREPDERLIAVARMQAAYHSAAEYAGPFLGGFRGPTDNERPYVLADPLTTAGLRAYLRRARDAIPDELFRGMDPDTRASYEQVLAVFRERAVFFERQIDLVEEHAPAGGYGSLPQVLIHGDFNYNNVLFQDDRPSAVIDFDYVRRTARIRDLANGFISIDWNDPVHGLDVLIRYLIAYQDAGAHLLSEAELRALPDMFRLQYLEGISVAMCWLLNASSAERRQPAERILRFLDGPTNDLRALETSLEQEPSLWTLTAGILRGMSAPSAEADGRPETSDGTDAGESAETLTGAQDDLFHGIGPYQGRLTGVHDDASTGRAIFDVDLESSVPGVRAIPGYRISGDLLAPFITLQVAGLSRILDVMPDRFMPYMFRWFSEQFRQSTSETRIYLIDENPFVWNLGGVIRREGRTEHVALISRYLVAPLITAFEQGVSVELFLHLHRDQITAQELLEFFTAADPLQAMERHERETRTDLTYYKSLLRGGNDFEWLRKTLEPYDNALAESLMEGLLAVFHEEVEIFCFSDEYRDLITPIARRYCTEEEIATHCARGDVLLLAGENEPFLIEGEPVWISAHALLRGCGKKTRMVMDAAENRLFSPWEDDPRLAADEANADVLIEYLNEERRSRSNGEERTFSPLNQAEEALIRLHCREAAAKDDLRMIRTHFGLQDYISPGASYRLSERIATMKVKREEDFMEGEGEDLLLPLEWFGDVPEYGVLRVRNEGALPSGKEGRPYLVTSTQGLGLHQGERFAVKFYHTPHRDSRDVRSAGQAGAGAVVPDDALVRRRFQRFAAITEPGIGGCAPIVARAVSNKAGSLAYYLYRYIQPKKEMDQRDMARKYQNGAGLLAHLHAEGLVHGDPHNENMIFTEAGETWFIDYDTGARQLPRVRPGRIPDDRVPEALRAVMFDWHQFYPVSFADFPSIYNDVALRNEILGIIMDDLREVFREQIGGMNERDVVAFLDRYLPVNVFEQYAVLQRDLREYAEARYRLDRQFAHELNNLLVRPLAITEALLEKFPVLQEHYAPLYQQAKNPRGPLRTRITAIRALLNVFEEPPVLETIEAGGMIDIYPVETIRAALEGNALIMALVTAYEQGDLLRSNRTERVDLKDVLTLAVKCANMQDGRAPVFLQLSRSDMTVQGSWLSVWMLVDNVIRNARQAVERAHPSRAGMPPVTVWGHKQKDTASIMVSDEGEGIPAEEWEQIFEFGHTGQTGAGAADHGVGLALCEGIARAHGGCIRVADSLTAEAVAALSPQERQQRTESDQRLTRGTDMEIVLPLAPAGESQEQAIPSSGEVLCSEVEAAQVTALEGEIAAVLVSSGRFSAEKVRALLEQVAANPHGYRLYAARDGGVLIGIMIGTLTGPLDMERRGEKLLGETQGRILQAVSSDQMVSVETLEVLPGYDLMSVEDALRATGRRNAAREGVRHWFEYRSTQELRNRKIDDRFIQITSQQRDELRGQYRAWYLSGTGDDEVEYLAAVLPAAAREVDLAALEHPLTLFPGVHSPDHPTSTVLLDALSRLPVEGLNVLDMGSGSGAVSLLLAQRGARQVTAVDLSLRAAANTRYAVNKAGQEGVITALQGDLFAPVQGERYDLIVFNLPGWTDWTPVTERFFREVGQYLNDGGRVIVTWPISRRPSVDSWESAYITGASLAVLGKKYGLSTDQTPLSRNQDKDPDNRFGAFMITQEETAAVAETAGESSESGTFFPADTTGTTVDAGYRLSSGTGTSLVPSGSVYVEPATSSRAMEADLEVCLACAAYNKRTGERILAHFLPTGHLLDLFDGADEETAPSPDPSGWRQVNNRVMTRRMSALREYVERLLAGVEGDDWQIVLSSMDEPGYFDPTLSRITASLIVSFLVNVKKVPADQIIFDDLTDQTVPFKTVLFAAPGTVRLFASTQRGGRDEEYRVLDMSGTGGPGEAAHTMKTGGSASANGESTEIISGQDETSTGPYDRPERPDVRARVREAIERIGYKSGTDDQVIDDALSLIGDHPMFRFHYKGDFGSFAADLSDPSSFATAFLVRALGMSSSTSFFRYQDQLNWLRQMVEERVREYCAGPRTEDLTLSVLSLGCSDGAELVSAGLVIDAALRMMPEYEGISDRVHLTLSGIDVDPFVIMSARAAVERGYGLAGSDSSTFMMPGGRELRYSDDALRRLVSWATFTYEAESVVSPIDRERLSAYLAQADFVMMNMVAYQLSTPAKKNLLRRFEQMRPGSVLLSADLAGRMLTPDLASVLQETIGRQFTLLHGGSESVRGAAWRRGISGESGETANLAAALALRHGLRTELLGSLSAQARSEEIIVPTELIPDPYRERIVGHVSAEDVRFVSDVDMEGVVRDALNGTLGPGMMIILTEELLARYPSLRSPNCKARLVILQRYDEREGMLYLEGALGLARALMTGNDAYVAQLYRALTGSELPAGALAAYHAEGRFPITLPAATNVTPEYYRDLMERTIEFLTSA